MLNQLEQISNGKYAVISTSTSGATIVAAKPGKSIRVVAYTFLCSGAVTVQFKSTGNTTSSLTGAMSYAANGGATPPFNPLGHFETEKGAALTVTLGGAVAIEGHLTYVEAE